MAAFPFIIQATDGGIYTADSSCLGLYAARGEVGLLPDVWREIAFLSEATLG